jgi:hypothetical protein
MPEFQTTEMFGAGPLLTYDVRVRGGSTVYVWGSDGIVHDASFTQPPVLHLRNHLLGESVELGTLTSSGTKKPFGTLEPGQVISVELQTLVAVFVSCSTETVVGCVLTFGGPR